MKTGMVIFMGSSLKNLVIDLIDMHYQIEMDLESLFWGKLFVQNLLIKIKIRRGAIKLVLKDPLKENWFPQWPEEGRIPVRM